MWDWKLLLNPEESYHKTLKTKTGRTCYIQGKNWILGGKIWEKKERICVFGSCSAVSLTHSLPFFLLTFPLSLSLTHLEGIWCGCVTPARLLWDNPCLDWTSDFSASQQTLVGRGKVAEPECCFCRLFLLHVSWAAAAVLCCGASTVSVSVIHPCMGMWQT